MVRTLATGCLVLLLAVSAWAGTITIDFGTPMTITTTANQNSFLTATLAAENAARAARNPPASALTLEQLLQQTIIGAFQRFKQDTDAVSQRNACTTFQGLTPTQQNTIVTNLGGNSPCP